LEGNDLVSEVTSWLEEHWDPALPVEEWWRLVGQAGWSAPTSGRATRRGFRGRKRQVRSLRSL
jgi:hypothetical protein